MASVSGCVDINPPAPMSIAIDLNDWIPMSITIDKLKIDSIQGGK
jgi:hypothetical protein